MFRTTDSGLATSLDRNSLDSTTLGVGVADNDVIYVCTWSAGDGTGAITEAGIFMGDNNGSMNYYTYMKSSTANGGLIDFYPNLLMRHSITNYCDILRYPSFY